MEVYRNFNDIPPYLRRKKTQPRRMITPSGLLEASLIVAAFIVLLVCVQIFYRILEVHPTTITYNLVEVEGKMVPFQEFCINHYELCKRV